MANKITIRQLEDGRWEAKDLNMTSLGDTEEDARSLLIKWRNIQDSIHYCRYCDQRIDYCICSSLSD